MEHPTSAAAPEAPPSSRIKLNRAVIVDAGLRLTARSGMAALSFRNLGRELACDHSAIYRHITDKDQLIRLLLDALIARALEAIPYSTTDWRRYLEAFAETILEAFVDHPSVGSEAVVYTTYGPAEQQAIENALVAMQSAGLDDTEIVHYFGQYTSFVLARAAGIARSRSIRGAASDEQVPWVDAPFEVSSDERPLAAQHRRAIIGLVDNDLYFDGVRLILDSIERRAARPQGPST